MESSIILGIGSGRCGTLSLAKILDRQPGARVTHEEPPLLPWRRRPGGGVICRRLARLRRERAGRWLGDVASFYLPYLEDAIAVEPTIRVVCLRRPREEVVASFCRWLDRVHPLPTNHWSQQPAPGWYHEPKWTRIFPQYDIDDRPQGIRRYWDEYYTRVEELLRRYPENIRLYEMHEALNTEAGLRDVLSFVGIPPGRQVLAFGEQDHLVPERPRRPQAERGASGPLDPRRCVVLVPYSGQIQAACERGLVELERRGYRVRRVGGYAAIDQGRNQMASDALLDGFEETMWIDSDIDFPPDAVERLRGHGLPLVCAIYPQKGKRSIACHVIPGTPKLVFGKGGGLVELLYGGSGFLHVRREVYQTIQDRLALPMCNERFGSPLLPFFHPMLHECDDGHWYLPWRSWSPNSD